MANDNDAKDEQETEQTDTTTQGLSENMSSYEVDAKKELEKLERKSKQSLNTEKSVKSAKSLKTLFVGAKKIEKNNAQIGGKLVHTSLSRIDARKTALNRLKVKKILGVEPEDAGDRDLGLEFRRPHLIYKPTFQLDPHVFFDIPKVEYVINKKLDEDFENHRYNVELSQELAISLAGKILFNVKGLKFNRYRILCVVTIGQKKAQSFQNAISFIWDSERDAYAEVHRETPSAFIQVTVFGVYLD